MLFHGPITHGYFLAGTWSCSNSEGCCLYVTQDGKLNRAAIGQHFNDGCNQCKCLESPENRGPWICTRKMCPCPYKNWERIGGWGQIGSVVNAWDERAGCQKKCPCIKRGFLARVDCEDQACNVNWDVSRDSIFWSSILRHAHLHSKLYFMDNFMLFYSYTQD